MRLRNEDLSARRRELKREKQEAETGDPTVNSIKQPTLEELAAIPRLKE